MIEGPPRSPSWSPTDFWGYVVLYHNQLCSAINRKIFDQHPLHFLRLMYYFILDRFLKWYDNKLVFHFLLHFSTLFFALYATPEKSDEILRCSNSRIRVTLSVTNLLLWKSFTRWFRSGNIIITFLVNPSINKNEIKIANCEVTYLCQFLSHWSATVNFCPTEVNYCIEKS